MTAATLTPDPAPVAQFGEPQLHTDGDIVTISYGLDGSLWSLEEPGILRHWNARSGKQIEWHTLSDLETLWCFSKDGRVLASASDDLTLWDASSGQVLTALSPGAWVTALAFHPDSNYIATGHDDGMVRFWDLGGHHVIHTLHFHGKPISSLVFSPDGTKLAVASEDKVISVWDLFKGNILGTLRGHTDRIPALAWHPTQPFLVSAGWDTTARVWNLLDFEPVILLNTHSGQVTALAFNRGGSLLACADSKNQVHLWDFDSKKPKRVLQGATGEVRSIAFNLDGTQIACNGDRVLHVWDTNTGQSISGPHTRYGQKTVIAAGNTLLATNGGGLANRVWNIQKQQQAFALESKTPVHQLAFSPKGDVIAVAAGDVLRLWDANGKLKHDCDGPHDPITCLAFSPDGSLVATGSEHGLEVWVWRVSDGEPILLIPDALDGCAPLTLAFHPEGKLLAVGGIDHLATGGSTGGISLWNIDERAEINLLGEGTTCLVFHPSGKWFAGCTTDNVICLWNTETVDLIQELIGHDGPINTIAYSPDGKWLASAGEDHTLRLWNEKGVEKALLEVDSQITSLAFSADGQWLFTGHANTTCRQFKVADLLRKN